MTIIDSNKSNRVIETTADLTDAVSNYSVVARENSGGVYEIALLETHVCVGWANLTNAGVRLEKIDLQTGGKEVIEFTLNDGIIDTGDRLFLMLNEAIEKRLTASEEIDDWAK